MASDRNNCPSSEGNARLDVAVASRPTARHFCGEAQAQVYISRWFESICSPAKPVMRVS